MLMAAGGIQIGDILAQLLIFLGLMLLLKKLAFGKLIQVMRDREDHIAGQIDSAEKSRKDAEQFLSKQQQALEESRHEAQQIIENAKKMGEDRQNDIIKAAQEEANRLRNDAVREIQNEREQALVSLREQVASLSVMVASKVIEKELSEADQQKFIEEYLKEAGDQR
ncbi:F0F1 ATP synthase subunit B [Bacillaceae bacterium SIJ1]|nr:F0F1 ATP synthase subunit B [Litoribacterium kuwaitense]